MSTERMTDSATETKSTSTPYFPLEAQLSKLLQAVKPIQMEILNGKLKISKTSGDKEPPTALITRDCKPHESSSKIPIKIRRASVALVLRPPADPGAASAGVEVLLLKRAIRAGDPWSGNVCLPGGHVDEGETLEQAALRETQEETGLDLTRLGARVLGRLDDRRATGTTKLIVISVFVFALPHQHRNPPVVLQTSEIVGHRWIPLSVFAAPETSVWHEISLTRFVKSEVVAEFLKAVGLGTMLFPAIQLPSPPDSIMDPPDSSPQDREHDFVLWGLTLTMISDLLAAGSMPASIHVGGPARPVKTESMHLPVGSSFIPYPRARFSMWTPAVNMMLFGWRRLGMNPGVALVCGMALNVGVAVIPATLVLQFRSNL
eukprot:CAMPEP_0114255376 /NCGR_PEP_ID=MMETSP0058-20121206/17521_1 /TAXON_ID=36894 /ORGANISM="Pyramimonas parkeae, CCMP726" /LENGTH=374 /DNA_ID=CAMNT_0001369741 /DNA_START=440 /DNA_END=1564 /DNA_ORIENTATION=-